MPLLSDQIQEFIDWLDKETDFSSWDQSVKDEVHKKLITCLISVPVKKMHRWEFYMNGTFCKDCGAAIGGGTDCK